MKTSLLMDFSVDKANKKVNVKREFDAPLKNVWDAWTKSDLLDQWWAPNPWKAKTKKQEFTEGGTWLYAMEGPKGEQHWSRADYKSIQPMKNYTLKDAFCDSNGTINAQMPQSNWNVDFEDKGNTTVVNISIKHDKLEDLENILKMGFKEGFTAGMENLDALLEKQRK
ncbi:MAG TPA: SRPBCC domain-containing protein [Bacteroidia bacterium]|jgi:PhnB protein|nr:SRPBCC domain-containing protein [Bacteroidia bacterium]